MSKPSTPKAKSTRTRPQPAPGRVAVNKLKLSRILVPLDFSGHSRQALETAIPLAERYGGKITLIHVVEPAYIGGEAGLAYMPVDNTGLLQAARERLQKTAGDLIAPALFDKAIVREGSAYHEITEAARKFKTDLIVIASQGHTGLSRVLLGSTAERVVRHAHCPVLTVRRD